MLHNAQHNANDEFYTRLDTIEQEFAHYDPKAFAGRTIYCPCDNPTCSMFVRFLLDHHAALRWSRLIASCWANPQPSLFSIESHPFLPMLLDVTRPPAPGMPVAWAACMPGNTLSRLDGDGDWRSAECSRLREQADLIVTNPPFSGARQLIGTLLNERKDMLLLSPLTVVNEPAIFQAIQEGRLRLGATMHAGAAKYSIPDTTPINAASGGTDGQGRYIRVTGVRWFATLPHDHTPAFRPHAHHQLRSGGGHARRLGWSHGRAAHLPRQVGSGHVRPGRHAGVEAGHGRPGHDRRSGAVHSADRTPSNVLSMTVDPDAECTYRRILTPPLTCFAKVSAID